MRFITRLGFYGFAARFALTVNNKTVNKVLTKLASPSTQAGQLKALTPIEEFVANDPPIIPTVGGAAFERSSDFSGWPAPYNRMKAGSSRARRRTRSLCCT
jgi:hypothetical protein